MIPGSFALIDDPMLALKVRCHWIRHARERIQAQYYSWEEDSSGKLLLSELLHAARRGVKVQLLVDDLYAGDNRFLEMVAHYPGIEVRLFNPFWLRGWRPLALLLEGLLSFRRINHRMHNKLLLVDGKQALIGGRNIGDRYFGLDPQAPFVDLDLACQGGPVPADGAGVRAVLAQPLEPPHPPSAASRAAARRNRGGQRLPVHHDGSGGGDGLRSACGAV